MKQHLLTVALSLTLIPLGCNNAEQPSDPTANVTAPGDLAKPEQGLGRTWQANLEAPAPEALHLRDDTLYVYDRSHSVWALDRQGGQLRWVREVAPRETTLKPPALMADKVVFPTNTTLEVFSRAGKKLETIPLGGAIRSGVAAGRGELLYMGISRPRGGRVIQVEPADDERPIQWELLTEGGVVATPATVANEVYVGTEEGRVYGLTDERADLWGLEEGAFVTAGPIRADLKADDSGVYVPSTDSKLYVLDRNTGKIKWQFFAGEPLLESVVLTDNTVYLPTRGQGLVALEKLQGEFNRSPKWVQSAAVQFLSQDDRYAYARSADNRILVLDRATGEIRHTTEPTQFSVFATNTETANIYAATPQASVYSIEPVLKPGQRGDIVFGVQQVD